MKTKDYVVLVLLFWWLLRDKPHAEVNIAVTEPGFPPDVNYEPIP